MNRLTQLDEQALILAIEAAEKNTSGEIRVHITAQCKSDPFEEALRVFQKLEMEKTKARNGVLVFLALEDRKMALVADKGINDLVPSDFWQSTRDIMISHFKQDEILEGLKKGLHEIGQQLSTYFPHESNDTNELSNDISYDD